MRILVTGGTGFLGSHLARALLQAGHEVSILGRDFGPVGALLAAGALPVAADLRDRRAVIAACEAAGGRLPCGCALCCMGQDGRLPRDQRRRYPGGGGWLPQA